MNHTASRNLTAWSKLLLALASCSVLVVPIAAGVLNAPRLRAQAQAAANEKLPEFEVASIKPNKSGPGPVQIQTNPGGRLSARNVTAKNLIQFANRLQSFQVIGGPDWLNADRFDIVAKGGDGADMFAAEQTGKPSRTQLMLQSLLRDRFKLTARNETRDLPMYALVLARSDGRPGSALRKSSVDCSTDRTGENVNKAAAPAGALPCGITMGLGIMTMNGATLPQFAGTLSGLLDRTVVDRTSLSGTFEASLKWTPDESTPGLSKKAAFVPTIDRNGPSIFTALQEQLGLKLDSTKGPVDVLIIVSAQQPTAN
ncbi:MAG TPA: TIGR03435 family protein [Vicinamibacterales bacterium]|nr:TIGR03435 family protein [Vicinamibacterales bacterium]